MDVNEITQKIIGCLYKVSNSLGCGFLEKVYVNASAVEISKTELNVKLEYPINIRYDNVIVGKFLADMLVADLILVEFKAVKLLEDVHVAQSLNYLRATGLPVCLLVNFYRPKLEIKRFIANPAWHK
ncbi:MAG: GxxExxY protein [Chloroflexi bacterium]|nr:GxxExxY protein [Chloroflexota bacterium]